MKNCNVIVVRAEGEFEDLGRRDPVLNLHRPLVHDQHRGGRDHEQDRDELEGEGEGESQQRRKTGLRRKKQIKKTRGIRVNRSLVVD